MNSSKLISVVLVTIMLPCFCYSQVTEEWVKRQQLGSGYGYGVKVLVGNSGNIYVAGIDNINDFVTVKYNNKGSRKWVAYYTNPAFSGGVQDMVLDNSENVYLTGPKFVGSNSDYMVIKYNSSGQLQWASQFSRPGSLFDWPFSLDVDQSGNVYVTGRTRMNTIPDEDWDCAIVKFNSSGIQQWVSVYDSIENVESYLRVEPAGNIYVASSKKVTSGSRPVILKYNPSGALLWESLTDINGQTFAMDIAANGNVYSTGMVVVGASNINFGTFKCDSSGTLQWSAQYDGPISYADQASALDVDQNGNVFVSGSSYSSLNSSDFATVKYNSSGSQQWAARYNFDGKSFDFASDLKTDNSGNVYVTGSINNDISTSDYCTIKYNQFGTQQWAIQYFGFGGISTRSYDESHSVDLDTSGNIFVTGVSNRDITTIKYSQSKKDLDAVEHEMIPENYESDVSKLVNITTDKIPSAYLLNQNYPNPFNPVTNLEFGISELGFVSLKIYDITGKEVAVPVNEILNPGRYRYAFDASGLPSGIYFYALTANGYRETKKMNVLK